MLAGAFREGVRALVAAGKELRETTEKKDAPEGTWRQGAKGLRKEFCTTGTGLGALTP